MSACAGDEERNRNQQLRECVFDAALAGPGLDFVVLRLHDSPLVTFAPWRLVSWEASSRAVFQTAI